MLESFADRLERVRYEKGLTQRALAKRAQISTNHYQAIAQANANPSVFVAQRLATALAVSVADLFDAAPVPNDYRIVSVSELRELVTSYEQLTEVVDRLRDHPRPGRRSRARLAQ